MTTAEADLPPYDPKRILSAPFPERPRLVCRTWTPQLIPDPRSAMVSGQMPPLVAFLTVRAPVATS